MQAELRQARQRFVASWAKRIEELATLAAAAHNAAAREDLARAAHRLVGAAGLVGFSTLSERAKELETAARAADAAVPALEARLAGLREAYAADEAAAPDWVDMGGDANRPPPLSLVIAEDDDGQRVALTRFLESAGHSVTAVSRGDEVLAVVRRLKPAILVLDVQLPGIDGYTVCRQVKADPSLAAVGVVFMTAAISTDDRLAGLLLGADDYIEKPVDLAEVGLRLSTVAQRRAQAESQPPKLAAGELSYADFVARTTERLQQTPGALVLLRMPAEVGLRVATWLTGEMRHGDLLGRYRDDLRILFLPGLIGRTATRHVGDIVARLAASRLPVSSGVASSDTPGARTLPSLLQDADASLAASTVATPMPPPLAIAVTVDEAVPVMLRRRSVLIADDDEGTRLLAVRPLTRAGIHFRTAADGREALDLMTTEVPEVLVLDLSMPNVDGLGVLEALERSDAPRPRVIVISANREEDDVRKALAMGADDYVVKPFNPLMLLARVKRLMH